MNKLDILMVGFSALIGMGFYVNTGTILRTGGPAAVVYAYVFLGMLSLMIMQGLSTMLQIWPIAGAITLFIEKFVDPEVAVVVTIMYW